MRCILEVLHYLLAVWGFIALLLIPNLSFGQVYEVADDNKPVFVGTRSGQSVWTEFGPDKQPAFYVDYSKGRLDEGRKAANGGTERTVFQGSPQTKTAVMATYISEDGTLLSSTTYAPRVEWIAGIPAALVESGATNHILWSDDITKSIWSPLNATTGATSSSTDPSGTTNTYFLKDDATAGTHAVRSLGSVISGTTGGVTWTFSVIAKAGTATAITLHDAIHNLEYRAAFNLSTGAVITSQNTTNSVQALGNGWYRCTIIYTVTQPADAGAVTTRRGDIEIYNGGYSYAGTGQFLYVHGAQVEQSPFPTSIIPTSGTSLQRAADSGVSYVLPTSPVGGSMFAESLGNELNTDVGFDDPGSWNIQAGMYIGGSSVYAKTDSSQRGNSVSRSALTSPVGKLYKTQFTITSVVAGGFNAYLGGTQNLTYWTTIGTHTDYGIPLTGSNNLIYLRSNSAIVSDAVADNFSVKQVLNGWENIPPHGTAVCWFRPGYNASAMSSVTQAVLDLSGDTIFQVYASGVTCTDGTTGATVAYTPVADKMVKLVAKWGYLSSNVAKMRVGIDTGSGITWGIEQNFDGAFSVGNQLRVLTSPWGRAHVAQLAIFSRIVDDGEINMWGSP